MPLNYEFEAIVSLHLLCSSKEALLHDTKSILYLNMLHL